MQEHFVWAYYQEWEIMMSQWKQIEELQEKNKAKNEIIFSKAHFQLGLSLYMFTYT